MNTTSLTFILCAFLLVSKSEQASKGTGLAKVLVPPATNTLKDFTPSEPNQVPVQPSDQMPASPLVRIQQLPKYNMQRFGTLNMMPLGLGNPAFASLGTRHFQKDSNAPNYVLLQFMPIRAADALNSNSDSQSKIKAEAPKITTESPPAITEEEQKRKYEEFFSKIPDSLKPGFVPEVVPSPPSQQKQTFQIDAALLDKIFGAEKMSSGSAPEQSVKAASQTQTIAQPAPLLMLTNEPFNGGEPEANVEKRVNNDLLEDKVYWDNFFTEEPEAAANLIKALPEIPLEMPSIKPVPLLMITNEPHNFGNETKAHEMIELDEDEDVEEIIVDNEATRRAGDHQIFATSTTGKDIVEEDLSEIRTEPLTRDSTSSSLETSTIRDSELREEIQTHSHETEIEKPKKKPIAKVRDEPILDGLDALFSSEQIDSSSNSSATDEIITKSMTDTVTVTDPDLNPKDKEAQIAAAITEYKDLYTKVIANLMTFKRNGTAKEPDENATTIVQDLLEEVIASAVSTGANADETEEEDKEVEAEEEEEEEEEKQQAEEEEEKQQATQGEEEETEDDFNHQFTNDETKNSASLLTYFTSWPWLMAYAVVLASAGGVTFVLYRHRIMNLDETEVPEMDDV